MITFILLLLPLFSKLKSASAESTSSIWKPFPTLDIGTINDGVYYVNVTIGSPPQQEMLRIDTSQPFVWVLSGADDKQCNRLDSGCLSGNRFYPEESTTGESATNSTIYSLNFLDTFRVNGSIVVDNLNFTNTDITAALDYTTFNSSKNNSIIDIGDDFLVIKNFGFINAEDSYPTDMGSLGLSSTFNETLNYSPSGNFNTSFSMLAMLAESGLIDSQSYSLWLGNGAERDTQLSSQRTPDPQYNNGKLLLGSVDPSLFKEPFYQFDVLPYVDPNTQIESFSFPVIPMNAIYIVSKTGTGTNVTSEDFLEPVLLNSNFRSNYLPLNSIIQIAIQVGATYVESLDRWLLPCSIANENVHFEFTFDKLNIKAPLIDFLESTFDSTTNTSMHFSDNSEACFLKLYPNTYVGFNALGRPFLKSVYLAVEQEGRIVGMAQAVQEMNSTFLNADVVPATTRIASSKKSVSSSSLKITATTTSSFSIPSEIFTVSYKGNGKTSSMSSTLNTTFGIAAMSSGYIPYATYINITDVDLSLSPSSASGYLLTVPGQFTATVYSNGIIVGPGRSFYVTSTSTTTRSSSSMFDSISLTAFSDLASSTEVTRVANVGNKRNTIEYKFDGLSKTVWCMLLLFVGGFMINIFM